MKKCNKKLLCTLLSLILAFSSLIVSTPTVSQAKMRINKKSATVTVGKTVKLKVKGTRSKVKWKSSNKYVAIVSSTGLVKGRHTGTCKIVANVSGKKFTCRIRVKAKRTYSNYDYDDDDDDYSTTYKTPTPRSTPTSVPTSTPTTAPTQTPSASPSAITTQLTPNATPGTETNVSTISNNVLASNIKVNVLPVVKTKNYLFTVTNNNSVQINRCDIKCKLYDSTGTELYSYSDSFEGVAAGETVYCLSGDGNKFEQMDPSKTNVDITVYQDTLSTHIYVSSSDVSISLIENEDTIDLTLVNNGTEQNYVDHNVVLFYDATGNIIAATEGSCPTLEGGATYNQSVNIPYEEDENGSPIKNADGKKQHISYEKVQVLYHVTKSVPRT